MDIFHTLSTKEIIMRIQVRLTYRTLLWEIPLIKIFISYGVYFDMMEFWITGGNVAAVCYSGEILGQRSHGHINTNIHIQA